ncbi:MAG: hypothetical protein ACYTGZ_19795 [Planctomycetota bacterium]|jgi:hypothetical protein
MAHYVLPLTLLAVQTKAAGQEQVRSGVEKRHALLDFEHDDWSRDLRPYGLHVKRVKDGVENHALRCAVIRDWAHFSVPGVPKDIRKIRLLLLNVRRIGEADDREELYARFYSESGRLEGRVRLQNGAARVVLPELNVVGAFDPERVTNLRLEWYDAYRAHFIVDDVRLLEQSSGWRFTRSEFLKHVFRHENVRENSGKYFRVLSEFDSGKLEGDLDRMAQFVVETLKLGKIPHKVDVYLFKDKRAFDRYVALAGLRLGTPVAGIATSRYVASYEGVSTKTVVHEVTHALFGAAVDGGGGAWLQEGLAVFVSELWMNRSASARIAARLPLEPRPHLRSLMFRRTLTNANALRAQRDYLAAGSFIEFLVRGRKVGRPFADLRALAKLQLDPSENRMSKIEKILGKPIVEIEAEWRQWVKRRGSD